MDVSTLIFLGTLMLFSLGFGISGFIGNKAEAYSPLSFSTRSLSAGILIALILFICLTQPSIEAGHYLLSYICLFLGVEPLIGAISVIASRKVSDFWWRFVRRKEQSTDRQYLIFIFFLLSFSFFFAFFLFYPPFISVG